MRSSFLCAIGLSLWSPVMAAQVPASPALSSPLRAHLKEGRFGIVTSIRGLPLGVRDALQALFGTPTLDIAEPDAPLQARRLVAAGCSVEHCVVYYERGGAAPAARVAVFHWTPAATRFEFGGVAPGGLTSIDEVRAAIVSGAVKGSPATW